MKLTTSWSLISSSSIDIIGCCNVGSPGMTSFNIVWKKSKNTWINIKLFKEFFFYKKLTSLIVEPEVSFPGLATGYGGGGVPGGVIWGNSSISMSLCLTCLGGERSFIDSDAIKRLLASDGEILVVPSCSGLDFVRWCLLSEFEEPKFAPCESYKEVKCLFIR